MSQKRYETVVGIFVVATLLLLLAMVLIVAQQERLFEKRLEYQTVFHNIGGLKEGAEVRLSGVTVGSVKKISFDPGGNIIVEFEVLAEYRERIRRDSKATIGYIGLLGDMCLDITSGSPEVAALPPGSTIPSVEPLDLTVFLERATPSLENLQNILANLNKITASWADERGTLNRMIKQLNEITVKINEGQGSLGMLVNDPGIYNDLRKAIAGTERIIASLNDQKGLMATLLHDPKFKSEAQKSIAALKASLENFRQASQNFRTMLEKMPAAVEKGEDFLEHLKRAGAELPELVNSGQMLINDADDVAQAAQKSWLLRRHIPEKTEKTIRMDREIQRGNKP
ncbi:MAG: MlaD family protein [Desulfobacteraceae bacterium]